MAKKASKKTKAPGARRSFHTCPCCGYEAGTKRDETRPGGRKFGAHVRSLVSKATRIPSSKITSNARGEDFSHARVAVIIAMRELAAEVNHPTAGNWPSCSSTIGRDRGSSHRLFNTHRDNPAVMAIVEAVVAEFKGAA